MIDYDKIIAVFAIILVVILCVGIPFFIIQDMKYNDYLKECYMQEHKTKQCEYALWKYENRTKTTATVMPVPIKIH